MSQLKFGIIGAGGIANATCSDLALNPDAEIVAVADPSEERARLFAERFAVADICDSADALLELDSIDAVYIAVPNKFHAEYARQALGAGKHTLLEKPFAMNLAEAQSVVDAAQSSERLFMVGMNQRFTTAVQAARAIVARGDVGEVFHAKAYWRRRSGIPRIGSWFTHKDVSGGGGLLDIGVHMLDVAMHVMGNFEPVSVYGSTYTNFGNRGIGDGGWGQSEILDDVFDVDDFATSLVKFANGATLQLEASWALHQASGNEMNVELYGTQGAYRLYQPELYRAGDLGYEIIQSPTAPPAALPHASRVTNFVNAILGREDLLVTTEESLAVQRILDGIYESSETGHEVRL